LPTGFGPPLNPSPELVAAARHLIRLHAVRVSHLASKSRSNTNARFNAELQTVSVGISRYFGP